MPFIYIHKSDFVTKRFISIIFALSVLSPTFLIAQTKSNNGDCKQAKRIFVMKGYTSPTAPDGFGEVLEISEMDKKSVHYFEEEHNTAWYKFKIPANGTLGFDIIPELKTDDYDFLLFEKEDSNTCDDIASKSLVPIRTCISRNDTSIDSWTGLGNGKASSFVHSGPGSSYSNELEVKKGEEYILVLDNVYENGGRHKIRFNFHRNETVSGIIRDEATGLPLDASVMIENARTGELISSTNTDPLSGAFTLTADLKFSQQYELVTTASDYFFASKPLDLKTWNKDLREVRELTLPQIIENHNYTIEGMNFEPNVATLVTTSIPKVRRLVQLMLSNPMLEILIEGHANCAGNFSGPTGIEQGLSEARSRRINHFLLKEGIDSTRLSTAGFGCTRMIVPDATTLAEQKKNMRVEIKVLKK